MPQNAAGVRQEPPVSLPIEISHMYKMREPLEKAGLRYVDNPEDV